MVKKIAVTGGKGGTGKSTFSVLLANKFVKKDKRVVLVDCDVECPNDYLLTGQDLKKPVKKVYSQFPKLNKNKCRKCGLCAQKCRLNAIFAPKGKYPTFIEDLCLGCGLCWRICPYQAIEIKKKVIGKVYNNKINDNLSLVTGQSVGVVDESASIVSETKKFANKIAKKIKADIVLFDSSVGLHCGVIRALIGVDKAYAVTEPTPLGAHDLDLILQLLETLKVPAEIVVNQYNLGKIELIEKISKNTGVKIAEKIPYSKKLVDKYSKGDLLTVNDKL